MHKLKIYHWFWMSLIPITILWSFFYYTSELVLDINIHDTYFVISYADVLLLLASYLFVIGNIYFLFNYWSIKLNKLSSNIHKYLSTTCIILIAVIKLYYANSENQDFPLFDVTTNELTYIAITFFVFLIAQLIFLINIILGIFKHGIQRTTRK